MLQVIPEVDSPITHSMGSSDKSGGIQASIVLKRPEPFFYDDYFADDDQVVYLTSSNEAEFFDPLFIAKEKALVITIGVYLNILKFMQDSWPEIKKAIKDKILLLQDKSFPLRLAPNVTMASDGHVVYERWFDQCFFFYPTNPISFPFWVSIILCKTLRPTEYLCTLNFIVRLYIKTCLTIIT